MAVIDIGIVRGFLELQENFTTVLDRATSKLIGDTDKLKKEFDKLQPGEKFKKIGDELTQFGSNLTKFVTLPIVGLGGAAVKSATDFESSFAGVIKTVGDATDEFGNLTATGQMLSDSFRAMSREIPVNVNEINRVGEAAGQLGIKSENIVGFTRVMLDLGASTNLSSDQAATALARLANITQMPQTQFDRLGSTVVALGNNFATTEAEIVEMSLRIAGAGAQIGLTEGEILAVATSLSSVGIAAEAGGSAISKVMIDMALAVSLGGKELQQFADVAGMSSTDFQRAFRDDAASAVESFIVGLGNMQQSGGDVLAVLDNMEIREVRMRDALLRTAGAGDLLTRALDLQSIAWDNNSALTDEAEKRYATFQSQLTIFWNRLKDVSITFGQSLIPVLISAMNAVDPLIAAAQKAAEWFGKLPTPIKTTAIALAGIAAAAGPVLIAVGSLTAAWGSFAASTLGAALIPAIGKLIALITGPVGWAIAAGVLLASWKPARDFVVDLGNRLVELGRSGIAFVVDKVRDWWKETETARRFLVSFATVIKDDVVRVVKQLFDWLKKIIREQIDQAKHVANLIRIFADWSGITQQVRLQVDILTGSVRLLWQWLRDSGDKAVQWNAALKGIVVTALVLNPATATMVGKLQDWSDRAQQAINVGQSNITMLDGLARSTDDGRVSVEQMDAAYEKLVTSTEEVVEKTDKATTSVKGMSDELKDALKGSFEGVIDFTGQFSQGLQSVNDGVITAGRGLGDYTDEMEENERITSILNQAYSTTKLTMGDLRNIYVLLSREYQEGGNKSEALAAALKHLQDRMNALSDETRRNQAEWGNLSASFGSAVTSMIVNGDSLSDSLSNIFGTQARTNFAEFIDDFSTGFGEAMASGQSSTDAIATAWEGSKDRISGTLNAIVAAVAATSGETEDLMIAALTAITSFMEGNWVGTIIAVMGIVIGLIGNGVEGLGTRIENTFDDIRRAISEGFDTTVFQDLLDLSDMLVLAFTDVRDSILANTGGWRDYQAAVTDFTVILDAYQDDHQNLIDATTTFSDAVQVATARFREFVDLAFEFGPAGVALVARVIDEMTRAGFDFAAALPVIGEMIRETIDKISDLLAQRAQFITDQVAAMVDGLTKLLTDAGHLTAAEIQFAADSVVQAFNAMVSAGVPLSDILAKLGPLFADIAAKGSASGLQLTGAFEDFGNMLAILSTGPMQNLINKLEGLAAAAQAAGNMGLLTASQFDTFGDSVRNAFNRMLAGGLSGEQALAALAPQLQLLWDLMQQYGFSVDAGTQRLLDMANAQGLLQDKSLTTEDILIKGFDRMIVALNALIVALGGVPVAFDDWTNAANDAADASTAAGDAATAAGDAASDAADDAADAISDLEDDLSDLGGSFDDWGDMAGDSAQSVARELDLLGDGISDLEDTFNDVVSSWQDGSQKMTQTWSNTARDVTNTADNMADEWIRDIDRVGKEWRDLMGEMENDFGGSVVADAIAARSRLLSYQMIHDFDTTAAGWAKTMSGMGDEFDNLLSDMEGAPPVTIPVTFERLGDPFFTGAEGDTRGHDPDAPFDTEGGDAGRRGPIVLGPPAAPDPRAGRGGARAGSRDPRSGGQDNGSRPIGESSTGLGDRLSLERLDGIRVAVVAVETAVKNLDQRLASIEARRRTN